MFYDQDAAVVTKPVEPRWLSDLQTSKKVVWLFRRSLFVGGMGSLAAVMASNSLKVGLVVFGVSVGVSAVLEVERTRSLSTTKRLKVLSYARLIDAAPSRDTIAGLNDCLGRIEQAQQNADRFNSLAFKHSPQEALALGDTYNRLTESALAVLDDTVIGLEANTWPGVRPSDQVATALDHANSLVTQSEAMLQNLMALDIREN